MGLQGIKKPQNDKEGKAAFNSYIILHTQKSDMVNNFI